MNVLNPFAFSCLPATQNVFGIASRAEERWSDQFHLLPNKHQVNHLEQLYILSLMDGMQRERERAVEEGGKEKLPHYFKGKATMLKIDLKLPLIIFKTSRWDLSLS